MDIRRPGEPAKNGQPTFSEHIFRVELLGPKHSHLGVIDVPGIFRTPTEGLTTTDDISLVQGMVQRFIKHKRTIILAVIPANVDIATQEILSIANEVDPHGQRTLGVLTKPDLVDRGAEKDVLDLVQGKKQKLRLGYYVVRNRGQQERLITTTERHQKESQFFRSGPFALIPKDRVGIPALQGRLRDLLNDLTQREFPHVKREISQRISACEDELRSLGPSRESDDQQRRYLLDLAVRFQKVATSALEARYGTDEFFKDEEMRLATRIITMNDNFSEAMQKKGCTVKFESGLASFAFRSKPKKRLSTSGFPQSPSKIETPQFQGVGFELVAMTEYPELYGVIHNSEEQDSPITEDILPWIERAYKSSRGFELGTFAPAILPSLFKEQTIHWEYLAMTYISRVIFHVHRFCDQLLSNLCSEERIKDNLWSALNEKLLQIYQETTEHVKFILRTEREGNLITMNHYFSDNLEKARADRLTPAEVPEPIVEYDISHTACNTNNRAELLARVAGISNLKHTVQDIHDILKSYYTVALARFIDNVCMQATDHHLVAGPETPLGVFSPAFVGNLTRNQLEAIAAEDSVSIQRRSELNRQIESLKEGKKVLAT